MGITEKYGTAIIAILIGGGFAFGGIASYSGLISSPNANNQQEFDAELPNKTFIDGSTGLTSEEKINLAAMNDVVFATGYYNKSSDREQLQSAKDVQSELGEKMYLNYVNVSEIPPNVELEKTPALHIVGAVVQGERLTPQQDLIYNITEKEISSATCDYLRDLPESAVVYCFG